MTTYPHERQIEYWVSRAIEDYFDNQGYNVVVLPNSNHAEKSIPYDHLFAGQGVKVFGLQYKRLHKSTKDYWEIDTVQLGQLGKFSWIYYALPEITSISQHKNILHLVAITRSASISNAILKAGGAHHQLLQSSLGIGPNKVPYYRWGGFVQKLFACTEGWHPTSKDELQVVLTGASNVSSDLSDTLTDIYVVPLNTGDSRLALRISPFVADTQEEFDYDFGKDWHDES